MYEPKQVKRIIMYLRGGKGNVGQIRTERLMQFTFKDTLVIAPYYRGYEGNGRDEFGGSDLADVIELIRLLKGMYAQIPIHLIGFSRGGLQGLLTCTQEQVTSLTCWAGVSSIYYMYEERKDLRGLLHKLVGDPVADKKQYDKREAVQLITAQAPPIMIIHGTEDKNVGIRHAYMLQERLETLGVEHEMHRVEHEAHVFQPAALTAILKEIERFIQQTEKTKQ
ncbi:S9 family peptidase [Macrococcus caseolyticus]|nr:S9 family peptidase [Macrococcus caseolyticus]